MEISLQSPLIRCPGQWGEITAIRKSSYLVFKSVETIVRLHRIRSIQIREIL
jgi:hypothetical protein